MCEECKCSIYLEIQPDGTREYGACENNCDCCSGAPMKALEQTLSERVAQLLSITEEQRDAGGDNNPILHAESGPNRFALMSLFFTDRDGVKIEEDLDLNTITVTYFTDAEELEIKEGALYEWALNYYRENY